jgi:UMF1 family MFS transporter
MIFGRMARKIGPKQAIYLGLLGYAGVAVFAYFMKTATHFLILALGVAVVQGGTQALSRSLFASLIPRHKSAEFFSFFALSERFAGILGPAIFAAIVLLTGSSRYAILSVIAFFIVGSLALARVDVTSGRRAAREAEASAAESEQSATRPPQHPEETVTPAMSLHPLAK